jgi:hypothetical protein
MVDATKRSAGWRVHALTLCKATLCAVALLGHAYLVLGLTADWLLTTRHAGVSIGAWAAALVLGIALSWRAPGWRVAGTFALALVVVMALDGWLRRGPEREELPADGDALVAALERHLDAQGRYPDSLEELDVTARRNAFGGWWYEPREGGRSYALGCGEYHLDLFVLYRSAEDEEWQWDT